MIRRAGRRSPKLSQRLVRTAQSPNTDNDEWTVGRRYFGTESMNRLYDPSRDEAVQALLELQSAEDVSGSARPDLHQLTRRDLSATQVIHECGYGIRR